MLIAKIEKNQAIRANDQQAGDSPVLSSTPPRSKRFTLGVRFKKLPAFFWTLFVMGLSVQAFSSGLKVANHSFVMPAASLSVQAHFDFAAIVARERKLQALSGLLVVSGAIGLMLVNRRVLIECLTGPAKSDGHSSDTHRPLQTAARRAALD